MTGLTMAEPILDVRQLTRRFGAIMAADDISLTIAPGEIVGVIGANGAGKTTFVNMVTGWTKPSSGAIRIAGRDVAGLPPRAMARLGVTRSFQIPQIFASQSVRQNLLIAEGLADDSLLRLLRPLRDPDGEARCDAVLERFGLASWAGRRVSELPQGVRKLLDIAMAMVRRPRLLLLDEPTSGVARDEKLPLMDKVMEALAGTDVTVLFVEHDMAVVEAYVTRVLAFYQGRVIADGPCAAVMADEGVREHVTGRGARQHRLAS